MSKNKPIFGQVYLRGSDKAIAEMIHYPDCWDTAAYPTLASALWEMVKWSEEHPKCPTCDKEQGWHEYYQPKDVMGKGSKVCPRQEASPSTVPSGSTPAQNDNLLRGAV
jgi:hypothetical protein